jgi:hypothetical protein
MPDILTINVYVLTGQYVDQYKQQTSHVTLHSTMAAIRIKHYIYVLHMILRTKNDDILTIQTEGKNTITKVK